MALWAWRTLSDGRVEVDRRDGQGYQPAPSIEHPDVLNTAERVLQWRGLAQKYADKYNIPVSWLLGFIFAESGGNPQAENFCCVGLMAIYWSVHGKTRADMLDPEKNIDYGASLLAKTKARGYQLPGVASVHVGGGGMTGDPHTAMKSPWGMREHMWLQKPQGDGSVGYIDRVVRANNYFVNRLGLSKKLPLAAAAKTGTSVVALLVGGVLGYQAVSDLSA